MIIKQLNKIKENTLKPISVSDNLKNELISKKANYNDLIEDFFSTNVKVNFLRIVKFRNVKKVSKGDIVCLPSPNSSINIFIASEDKEYKMLVTSMVIKDSSISANYILWFLNHEAVREFLLCFSTGAVLSRIPLMAYENIDLPIPISSVKFKKVSAIAYQNIQNPFRSLINRYYSHYMSCINKEDYMSSAVWAGTISEAFLYHFLVELNYNLKKETLGRLIDIVKKHIIQNSITDFPISAYDSILPIRNAAVHPNAALQREESVGEFDIKDFKCFDVIIKYFGL